MGEQVIESLVNGGQASAAPPLGPALGPLGVNIGEVVAEINKKTDAFKGMQVPVKVKVDEETKKFSISVGTPPAASLIKQEAHIKKGSGRPKEEHVADLRIEQIIKIAKMKEEALLGKDLKSKVKEVIGTCNSMGVMVGGKHAQEAIQEVNTGKYDNEISQEKTELSEEELKTLEEERKTMQEELEKKHAKEEAQANSIIKEMTGQERSAVVAKLREAEVSEDVINKLLPVETEGAPEGGAPAEGAAEKKEE